MRNERFEKLSDMRKRVNIKINFNKNNNDFWSFGDMDGSRLAKVLCSVKLGDQKVE